MSCCHCQKTSTQAGEANGEFKKKVKGDNPPWVRLAVALVLAGQAMMVSLGLNTTDDPPAYSGALYWGLHGLLMLTSVVSLMLLGGPLLKNFWDSLVERHLTIEALFVVTLLGAVAASVQSSVLGQGAIYYEVVTVVLIIYTFGNTLKEMAGKEARKILEAARADFAKARRVQMNGESAWVEVGALRGGDIVELRPGELLTVEGVVESGRAFVEQSALTGEPVPLPVGPGDKVLAGIHSLDGLLRLRVADGAHDVALRRLLENFAKPESSSYERLADRVVGWFLPIVAAAALVTFAGWSAYVDWQTGLFNAMSVLLIACPCALGMATPLAVQAFLYKLGKFGWRGRSGELVERLAEVDTIFFDKTGTLTLSSLKAGALQPTDEFEDRQGLLKTLLGLAESKVNHPIALAFQGWAEGSEGVVENLQLFSGRGVRASVKVGAEVYDVVVGQKAFVEEAAPAGAWGASLENRHIVYMALDGRRAARVGLEEQSAPKVEAMLWELLAKGYKLEVLTGDPAPSITFDKGVTVRPGLSMEQKAQRVQQAQSNGAKVLFVGDGINDAPALRMAHASLAVAEGSLLSHAAAQAVVGGGQALAGSLGKALKLAHAGRGALRWNLRFAAYYNFIGITLAMLGCLNPVAASLLMLSSSIVVAWRAVSAAQNLT